MAATAISFAAAKATATTTDRPSEIRRTMESTTASTSPTVDSFGRADASAVATDGSPTEGSVHPEDTKATDIAEASAGSPAAARFAHCYYKKSW